jgi:VWFA-related protein
MEEVLEISDLTVFEDKDQQQILSIRTVDETPLTLAFIVQDDLSTNFNLLINEIREFITRLPQGSRVLVAYARSGTPQIRQRFTEDREKAAAAIRPVVSSETVAPRSPYDSVIDIIKRFDSTPVGRRAIIFFSDGLDYTSGADPASIIQSQQLERAVREAQRRSITVYSIYIPNRPLNSPGDSISLSGQSALQRLSEETGGQAFFQGNIAPLSLVPFFRDLSIFLTRQFLLTYLSTHMNRGYHRIEIRVSTPGVKIAYPKGYFYR